MNKAGKLQIEQSSVVTKFKRECTRAENNGEDAQRSIEALLKYAKNEQNGAEENEVTREKKTYATFSISKDGVNGKRLLCKAYRKRYLYQWRIRIRNRCSSDGDI